MGKFEYERFKWADKPPAVKAKPIVKEEPKGWNWVVAKLKKKPGMWARVRTDVSPTNIPRLKKAFPEVKFVSRPTDKPSKSGNIDIWASYPLPQEIETDREIQSPDSFQTPVIPTAAIDWESHV